MDQPGWRNDRCELELYAKLLELHGDGVKALGWLDDGKRKFAARQKAGLFTVDGDQIGLGKNLKQVPGLQGFNDGPEMELRAEQKQIQEVPDRRLDREACDSRTGGWCWNVWVRCGLGRDAVGDRAEPRDGAELARADV